MANQTSVKPKPTDASQAPVKPKSLKPVDLMIKFRVHKTDTGSSEVQIIQLSARVEELVKHLKKHSQDKDSKRGLLMIVGKRRRLLNYLQKRNPETYQKLVAVLGLRG